MITFNVHRPLSQQPTGRSVGRAAGAALVLAAGLILTGCGGDNKAHPGPIARASSILSAAGSVSGSVASSLSSTAVASLGVVDSTRPPTDSGDEVGGPPASAEVPVTTAVGQPSTDNQPTDVGPSAGGNGDGQGSTATTSSATTVASADVDPAAYGSAADGYYWSSPSGNINCAAQDGTAYCGASQHTFAYQGSNCLLDAQGVEIKPGFLVEVTCGGDAPQNISRLAYGRRISIGTVTCVSEMKGMTCVDGAHGNGFSINRSSITILPNGDHPLPYQPSQGRRRSAPSTSPTPTTPPAQAGALPAQYAGTWQGHGALLSITASGTATAIYRTYTWCGSGVTPPCDNKAGTTITPGGHLVIAVGSITDVSVGPIQQNAATGRVLHSDDPRHPVGSAFSMLWSGAHLQTPIGSFCPAAGSGTCG